MSWLVPSALAIAGIGAVAAIALHFIARSRPLAESLPTARFVPDRAVRARTRSFALSDVILLLVRAGALLSLGVAVAGPVFASAHGRTARLVLVDRSRAVASAAELRDSVRALARPGDALIAFDTSVASVQSIDSIAVTHARGSLSAALAAAIRRAAVLAREVDSVELAIVSPFATDEFDAATSKLRDEWRGRIRVARVGVAASGTVAPVLDLTGDVDDAVIAGLSLMSPRNAAGWIRIVRGAMSSADSLWARDAGHVLVHWPKSDTSVAWGKRGSIDAIGAVASETGVLVARLPRLWVLDGPAVARWADGDPAAVEHAVGGGCIRDVGVLVDAASDVTLHQPFRDFARGLLAPCGGMRSSTSVSPEALTAFSGGGGLASAESFRVPDDSSRWTPWLLALAAALLTLELAMRRSSRMAA